MKDFSEWHELKGRFDAQHEPPIFKAREVWWCSIGLNVGFEIDGKNELFNRPILVLRKFGSNTFIGVPFTSKIKELPNRVNLIFKDKAQQAILSQIRSWDAKRLTHKMGEINQLDFQRIVNELKSLF